MNETGKKKVLRIGTRKSALAMVQTRMVIDAIKAIRPKLAVEIVPLVTFGDKILERSLTEFGGKGAFVSEFETAIRDGQIDAAVHSAKDMPVELLDGLAVLAVLPRGDARDVYVTVKGRHAFGRPVIVGTGSPRRRVQITERMDAECRLLRGNVPTRLEKLYAGEYDGIILAAAGLKRLNCLADERFSFEFLKEQEFLPAAGQGIIAVEARKDSCFSDLLKQINHGPSAVSFEAEREVLKLLGAGCTDAVGVYSWMEAGDFHIQIMRETGDGLVKREICGKPEEACLLADRLVRQSRR